MPEFNANQQRLRRRIKETLEEKGGSAHTSDLKAELYSEFGHTKEKKQSFQRQLLRIRPDMVEAGDVETEKEHTSSSRREWRWYLNE